MNSEYVELYRYNPGTTMNMAQAYWLASRCVYHDSGGYFNFSMFSVSGGGVNAYYLYYSTNSTSVYSFAIRPVVEIDLSKVNVGLTGDGGRDTPYSIEKK